MPARVQQATCTTSDGAAIAFARRAAPRPGAPRIVLLHSLALDRSMWDAVVEILGDEAEILTYDCRGHGGSERRAGRFTAELFARDLAELLDQVGWQDGRPDLVEHTSGVFVANDLDCYAASCALLGDADLRPHLAALAMPVAILVGEDDTATPVAMARELHAAIARSTLRVVPAARHLTPIECPGPIAAALLDLLRGGA
jgi:pimeloyl-ACP methyl ester carboxylesterase